MHEKYPIIISICGRTIQKESYKKEYDEILTQMYTSY